MIMYIRKYRYFEKECTHPRREDGKYMFARYCKRTISCARVSERVAWRAELADPRTKIVRKCVTARIASPSARGASGW